MKPPSGLRCCKQEGNLNQSPFLIESLLRTLEAPRLLFYCSEHQSNANVSYSTFNLNKAEPPD